MATGETSDTGGPLGVTERSRLRVIRLFGALGALLMSFGALGAGAEPVYNPLLDIPVLNLFPRMPTVALGSVYSGMAMVVLAWLWLGRYARPGRPRLVSKAQMARTLVMWALPLALVPPMFSRDVYSYLAQCKITGLGLNPYTLGPAQALGVADPLVRGIPNIWRDTPAPYGPLFLSVCRGVPGITGNHVVLGIMLERVLELVGVGLIVWALPRLARRFGVHPVSALWLGAANPLVLWHLVSGSHNEALMIGLMLAGFEIALLRLRRHHPPGPPPPLGRAELACFALGVAVVCLGALVKIPAAAALGFLGMMLARRLGGRLRHLAVAIGVMVAISAVVIVGVSVGSGLGFGWIAALGTPGMIKSWMAPATAVGFLASGLGLLLGLGNHTDAVISTARALGAVGYAVISVKLLWDTFRGRMQPMVGVGLCLGVIVILGATVQPWYLLWAAIPLAAGAGDSRFRTVAAGVSALVAMFVPPTGSTFDGRVFVLPEAIIAAAVLVGITLVVVRRRLPLLRDDDPDTGAVSGSTASGPALPEGTAPEGPAPATDEPVASERGR